MDKMLTAREVAAILGVSAKTLRKYRQQKKGIPYIKLGDAPNSPVRYYQQEVERYVEAHRVTHRRNL